CRAWIPAAQKFCGECGGPVTATRMATLAPSSSVAPPSPALREARPAVGVSRRPPASPRSTAKSPLPFIGREDDLAWLEDRRTEARSLGGARLVGEIGVGKSR